MRKKTKRLGILSTLNEPLLPMLLLEIEKNFEGKVVIIFDEKCKSTKDLEIWEARTKGFLNPKKGALNDFLKSNTSFHFTRNHNDQSTVNFVKEAKIDLLINGGTPRKITDELINAPAQGILNAHPGVLPRYRGSCCVEWSILENFPVGHSVHFMSKDYDEGPIVFTEYLGVSNFKNYEELRIRMYIAWASILARAATKVIDEDLHSHKLQLQGKGKLYGPINSQQLLEVKRKIARNEYMP